MVEPTDTIEVEMHLYQKDIGVTSIVTTNSTDRSLIGSYFNAVKQALISGDESGLEQYRHTPIIDAEGNAHRFETDLDTLHKIEDSIEEPEFFDIYV